MAEIILDEGQLRASSDRGPSGKEAPPLLRVSGICVRFGGIIALDHVSFDVREGHICGLIGPNGAGKTTLFNCLSRIYAFQEGEIFFQERPLSQMRRHSIASIGIGRTFQNLALFPSLTVLENIAVGGHSRLPGSFLSSGLGLRSVSTAESGLLQQAKALAELVGLAPFLDRLVGSLPFGFQKKVELTRALMSRPKLLLLDEPAAGLNHEEVEIFENQIRMLRGQFDLTILVVEHHMNLVMRLSDHVVALDFGKKIADGSPKEVQNNTAVVEAYLGGV